MLLIGSDLESTFSARESKINYVRSYLHSTVTSCPDGFDLGGSTYFWLKNEIIYLSCVTFPIWSLYECRDPTTVRIVKSMVNRSVVLAVLVWNDLG